MALSDISLVCEGVIGGPDVRWLGLVLDELALTHPNAGRIDVVPAGSKADLAATVRGLRASLDTRQVFAVRDRDFLRSDDLQKRRIRAPQGEDAYPLDRHCLESYLLDPELLGAALGLHDAPARLTALATQRFWCDVGRAALDDLAYQVRGKARLGLGTVVPGGREDVVNIVREKLDGIGKEIVAESYFPEQIIDSFATDMQASSLPWTRVDGKELLRALEDDLRKGVLPGGELESRLFKWCASHGPPAALIDDVTRALLDCRVL